MDLGVSEQKRKDEIPEITRKVIHTYPLIRHVDMSEEMKSECMEVVVAACEKHPSNHEAAAKHIKENLDKKYGPSWHCVVGENFALEISHEARNILYMFISSNLGVCAWKCS